MNVSVQTFRNIFTVHKWSCGKVMFSQACVKNSVHRGCIPACTGADTHLGRYHLGRPPWADTPRADNPLDRHLLGRHPPGRHPPGRHLLSQADTPPADGYSSRRYASYWNAFLLRFKFCGCVCLFVCPCVMFYLWV